MKLEETKFGDALKLEGVTFGFDLDPADAGLLLNLYISAIVDFLSSVKVKKERKISIRVTDDKTDFLIGFACEYHEPEEVSEVDTGNWTLIGSFKEDEIKFIDEDKAKYAKVYESSDDSVTVAILNYAARHFNIRFHSKEFIKQLCIALFRALNKYIDDNAKIGSEEVIEIANVAIIKFEAEKDKDGKPSYISKSIDLDGSLKRKIKDDSVLSAR